MSIVACPKCTEKVSLPPKTPPAAKVRCPLCGENYLLSEALSALPPMLEVVELPEDYRPEPEDIDISAAAFLSNADRPAPSDDDGDLKLEESPGGVATAEGEEPRYDQWGATKSSAAVSELAEPVKRDLVATPRRKKKTINPLFHIVGIVMGGVIAIPTALLILLWMPGSWRRDPMEIGPWLGKNAPYLVPSDLRKDSTTPANDTSTTSGQEPKLASAGSKNKKGQQEALGLELGGSKFDNALQDPETSFGPDNGSKRETPLIGGVDGGNSDLPGIGEPSLENPLEPSLDDPLLDPPAPKTKPKPLPKDDLPLDPSGEPKLDLPVVPEPVPPAEDPLATQRTALADAEATFKDAPQAEKKAAALAMYAAAARLAEKLPSDAGDDKSLRQLSDDPTQLQFVGMYAAVWLDDSERTTTGIVLSGNVLTCELKGERYEVRVELPSKDKREVVLISPVEFAPGDKVFAAGRIVDNAKDMIGGYEGEATRAIDGRVVKTVSE